MGEPFDRNALLSCPFCGSRRLHAKPGSWKAIVCGECFARGPDALVPGEDRARDSLDLAIRQWNRRMVYWPSLIASFITGFVVANLIGGWRWL